MTRSLGKWGEGVAATYLEAQGYEVVMRNWRCVWGEIDIIARQGEKWAFTEVKTRRGRAHGSPEEAISPRKAANLQKLALLFLAEREMGSDVIFTIDLIAVELDGAGKLLRVEQYVNAVVEW